jgi:hypothetical protein
MYKYIQILEEFLITNLVEKLNFNCEMEKIIIN